MGRQLEDKYQELLNFNMESNFREVEHDLKKLDKVKKQKCDLDKRHNLIYGGPGKQIFPSRANLNKAVSMAGESPTKGVRFKI